MGGFTNTALGIMFAVFLVAMFAGALEDGSSDANKKEFKTYEDYKNWSEEFDESNVNYTNTGSSVSNMQLQAERIANKIAEAQAQINSNDLAEQILGAFGILSALSIDVFFLMLAIMVDGANFVMGATANISNLSPPFDQFASVGVFAVALFIVYVVFKIAAAVLKWDI